jgi:small-conductance mechanosensitive channel
LDITLTNVHLLSEDDDIIYIPNNKVFSEEIINYTRRDLKKSYIDFQINPYVISDISELEKILWNEISLLHVEIIDGSFSVKTVLIKVDAVDCKVHYILKDPLNREVDIQIKRILKRKIVTLINPR